MKTKKRLQRKLWSPGGTISGGRVGGNFLFAANKVSKKSKPFGGSKPPNQSLFKDLIEMDPRLKQQSASRIKDKQLIFVEPLKNTQTQTKSAKEKTPTMFARTNKSPSSSLPKRVGKSKAYPKKGQTHVQAAILAAKTNAKISDRLEPNKKGIGMIPNVSPDGPAVQPASVDIGKRTLKLATNSETRIIHKTHYQTGFLPSKALREAARVNGTSATVLYDSKMDQGLTASVLDRNQLTQGAGFNSKQIHVPSYKAQLSRGDLTAIMSRGYAQTLTQVAQNQRASQVFAGIMKLKRQFMIMNTSAFLPMHFKITIARLKGGLIPLSTYLEPFAVGTLDTTEFGSINTAIAANTSLDGIGVGKVPWIFTHGPANLIGGVDDVNRFTYTGNFSLKSKGLWESNGFKQSYEMVESFEKLIPPGDFWNFSHTHNCGGGIDLGAFADANDENGRSTLFDPCNYTIFFETKGTMCEGIVLKATGRDAYLGSSPTYYTYEHKTSVYYVKDNDKQSVVPQPNNSPDSLKVYRREFVRDNQFRGNIQTLKPEFFVNNTLITPDPNTTVIGEMYIPTPSASVVRFGTTQAGNNVG